MIDISGLIASMIVNTQPDNQVTRLRCFDLMGQVTTVSISLGTRQEKLKDARFCHGRM